MIQKKSNLTKLTNNHRMPDKASNYHDLSKNPYFRATHTSCNYHVPN